MTWIVREGRTTRYLYICRSEQDQHPKIAEVDLWAGTPADASLMAAAPALLAALKSIADNSSEDNEWDAVDKLQANAAIARAAITAAETQFVQTYAKNVSKE